MADEPELLTSGNDEDGGGPIKSFLEHLEDLRWTLVRCAIAMALGMLVCLSASNYIIEFLKWPLERAQSHRVAKDPQVSISLGTNLVAKFQASAFPPTTGATNDVYLRLSTIATNGLNLAVFEVDTNPPAAARQGMHVDLGTLGPAQSFTVALQIMMYGGLTVSAPFVIYFIAQFVLPALHQREKKWVYQVSGFSIGLFFAGVSFCYFFMMVISLGATVGFSNWLGFRADLWQASDYISFISWFMLGTGLSFQLPLVLLTLVKIGLVDSAKLRSMRPYWVVAGLVVAGLITPDGSPLTMMLMFLPLEVLYEITVVIAWWWERKARIAAKQKA
jgi:sec-independent protein translocase protein TatC